MHVHSPGTPPSPDHPPDDYDFDELFARGQVSLPTSRGGLDVVARAARADIARWVRRGRGHER